MKKFTLSVVAVLAMSAFAVAGGDIEPVVEPVVVEQVADDSGFYMGLGYTYLNLNIEADGEEADAYTSASTFLAGYKFNQYIAVEGRYVPQFAGVDFDGDTVEASVYNLALYAKGMYPVTEAFDIYALLGFGMTELEVEFTPNTESRSDTAFQWGLGASYDLSTQTSLFIDYSVMYNDTGFDGELDGVDLYLDAWTFGMTYKF